MATPSPPSFVYKIINNKIIMKFSYYVEVLKKYAVFSGRARRSEYWSFVAVNFLIGLGLGLFGSFIIGEQVSKILSNIYVLAILIPSIAVSVRRLHDTGRSGWWILVSFIPIIGFITLIVFYCKDSHPGENKYGPNPKTL